jgi:hypothetical protein
MFPGDLDLFDRVGGGELVDGGDGEDRLALIERLVGQRAFAFDVRRNSLPEVGHDVGGRREFVGGENAFHARHGERSIGVDAHHAAVRDRTEEQLTEQHAVDAEVLRVSGLAGHLRDEIGGHIILTD